MSDETNTSCCGGEMPKPTSEHDWLQRFVGEWASEGEVIMGPDQPNMKLIGSEKVRSIGGFWVVGEITSEQVEMPYEQTYTIGYDPEQKKYHGTVIDSMSSYFWRNEGTVSGDSITLMTEGPSPMNPTGLTKYRETTEFKTLDHKVFTSEMQGPDGEWFTFMTINCRRKK